MKQCIKDYRNRSRDYVWEYLNTHSCVDCGESDPFVLEFDHVRDSKFKNVSKMAGEGYSIDRIQLEIDKCDIRCANCHRRKTMFQFGYWSDKIST